MLQFENRFVRQLPGDPDERNQVRQVHGAAWSKVRPTPVTRPSLLASSPEVLGLLGLSPADARTPQFAEVFGGNALLPGMEPYAACYGGHQFGVWAGQLGDGRAITLGEAVAPGARLELQLKGAGPTPYRRRADGRAVLRSSVREFLCSEAMHHLGVPTTRALSLVSTGEPVLRDMFYDGNPRHEPGAVVCRVAPSFLRFGNFELPARRGDHELLRRLVQWTLENHFPQLGAYSPAAVVALFEEVGERTLRTVTDWMRVGFVHGVMNTDNMSILGLTIDYGPYGWLEPYDPDWTPNTTDAQGRRYRYGNQPLVALWNLARLAEALLPLVGEAKPFEVALEALHASLPGRAERMMRGKLGLTREEPADAELIASLHRVFAALEVDLTLFFRGLADLPLDGGELEEAALLAPVSDALYVEPDGDERAQLSSWLRSYRLRAITDGRSGAERRAAMNRVNPRYVLRNYLAQLAIDRAEDGDPSGIDELLEVLRRPYEDQPGKERFAARRPEWARHKPGCSMLSCSS